MKFISNKKNGGLHMEVLELKPVKNKKVQLYLIKNEDNTINSEEYKFLEDLFHNRKISFVVATLKENELNKSIKTPLLRYLDKLSIPFFNVDIPEHVKYFFYSELSEQESLVAQLSKEYNILRSNPAEKESFKTQNLKSWIDLLKMELKEKKEFLTHTVKSNWIVKKVLDLIHNNKEKKISIIHFSPEKFLYELRELFESYNVIVKNYDFSIKNDKKSIPIST